MARPTWTAIAVLAFAFPCAGAQSVDVEGTRDPHAVQPERPTVATHAGTVAAGWVELETGVERDEFAAGAIGLSTPTTLKVGLASHMQLGVADSWQRAPLAGRGIGDLTIDLKWRLLDDAPLLGDFAILPALKLPTGSRGRGTGTGTSDAGLLLISSHSFGGTSLDVNAGYARRGFGTHSSHAATLWTTSLGIPLRGVVGLAAELFGYPGTGGSEGTAPSVALLAGPTLQPRAWLAFDTGAIVPLAGPQPRAIYLGAVWNIGHLPHR